MPVPSRRPPVARPPRPDRPAARQALAGASVPARRHQGWPRPRRRRSPGPRRGRPGNEARAGNPIDAACAPAATSTDFFFCQNSAELTDSDKRSLDDYASAYLAGANPDQIELDGYASTEGEAKRNQQLSKQRADAVANYLIQKGVAKSNIKRQDGHGATDRFSNDLGQNRRATIKPPPPKPALRVPKSVRDKNQGPYLERLNARFCLPPSP